MPPLPPPHVHVHVQVNTLFVLMGEKKEDDEFVLQIAFSFNKFMMYEDTRTALLNHTQVRGPTGRRHWGEMA